MTMADSKGKPAPSTGPGPGADASAADEAAASAATGAATGAQSAQTESLLGLIDKLTALLERSDLVEIEVEAGETGIVLRKPAALAPVGAPAAVPVAAAAAASDPAGTAEAPASTTTKVVRAPLTGIYYSASSPTAPPYVTVGQHVTVGQVIGLIEAMKLFNEIKSDVAGRVVRVVAETGKLVKTKSPLIEVEP
jgi:acetyl-CoA carboxylase biotin carboxyl carrier protein